MQFFNEIKFNSELYCFEKLKNNRKCLMLFLEKSLSLNQYKFHLY